MGASRPQTPRCFLVLDYLFSSTRKLQFYVELAVDSVKYIAVIEKDSRTIKNANDIYTIKKALSKSYCIKPKSIMKHPPYTGTMTIYCDNETFVYEIYGNTFVSGDNIHYMAPINLSWSIKSFGE